MSRKTYKEMYLGLKLLLVSLSFVKVIAEIVWHSIVARLGCRSSSNPSRAAIGNGRTKGRLNPESSR